ncbi:MAG: hypothetical protein ACO3NK_19765 [Prochlorotrichaceae cyanobacterium]|jgi:predicted transcriptional regulator
MATTREQLLQELGGVSDEVLLPLLEFVRLLKAYPQNSRILGQMLCDCFELLEPTVDYEQWLTETRSKVAVALAEIDRGELLDSEEVINRLQTKVNHARSQTL